MYIPALQARQAERGAILSIADKINDTGLCTPFYMPVTGNLRDVSLLVRQMSNAEVRHFLLTTPLSKYATYSQADILSTVAAYDEKTCSIPAVALNAHVSDAAFAARVKAVQGRKFAIYHDAEPVDPATAKSVLAKLKATPDWHLFRGDTCTTAYMHSWSDAEKFIINDEFNRRPRNQDYADSDDEAYSKLVDAAFADGFDGFGDFTITGDFFSPTGGRAGAVTIHFSYPRPKDGAWIRHFVSENTDRNDDVAPKFIDSTGQLLAYVASSKTNFDFSTALAALSSYHADGHFPGLPTLKKLSIQHHIELMIYLLKKKA